MKEKLAFLWPEINIYNNKIKSNGTIIINSIGYFKKNSKNLKDILHENGL